MSRPQIVIEHPILNPPYEAPARHLVFDEWTGDRIEENRLINQIRERIRRWRSAGQA